MTPKLSLEDLPDVLNCSCADEIEQKFYELLRYKEAAEEFGIHTIDALITALNTIKTGG